MTGVLVVVLNIERRRTHVLLWHKWVDEHDQTYVALNGGE